MSGDIFFVICEHDIRGASTIVVIAMVKLRNRLFKLKGSYCYYLWCGVDLLLLVVLSPNSFTWCLPTPCTNGQWQGCSASLIVAVFSPRISRHNIKKLRTANRLSWRKTSRNLLKRGQKLSKPSVCYIPKNFSSLHPSYLFWTHP